MNNAGKSTFRFLPGKRGGRRVLIFVNLITSQPAYLFFILICRPSLTRRPVCALFLLEQNAQSEKQNNLCGEKKKRTDFTLSRFCLYPIDLAAVVVVFRRCLHIFIQPLERSTYVCAASARRFVLSYPALYFSWRKQTPMRSSHDVNPWNVMLSVTL